MNAALSRAQQTCCYWDLEQIHMKSCTFWQRCVHTLRSWPAQSRLQFLLFSYELRKLTHGKRFIALSNSFYETRIFFSTWSLHPLASENPCQNLHQVTRRFLLHYYELNVTCVCSSSILDATVKGAVPRGPRLLTSVDTATSLGTSGPKRKNSGQAHTWLKVNTLYIALNLVYTNRIQIKNGKHQLIYRIS